MISVDVYLEIADLFRFRYDPAVLGIIAERPHRFRELVSRLESHVEGHVDDNAVGRSLKRLARVKHVAKTHMQVGRRRVPVYRITDEGCLHLRVYDAFADAYLAVNPDSARAKPGTDTPA